MKNFLLLKNYLRPHQLAKSTILFFSSCILSVKKICVQSAHPLAFTSIFLKGAHRAMEQGFYSISYFRGCQTSAHGTNPALPSALTKLYWNKGMLFF